MYHETGCDTARSNAAIRPSMRHDTAQKVRDTAKHVPRYGAGGARYGRKGCDRARPCARHNAVTRCASTRLRPVTWSGTGATQPGRGPRYGPTLAKTQRSALTACAQPGPWVCALCTRPSFDSVHYSKSLFESLFINTVHEHSSRGFQKKKIF